MKTVGITAEYNPFHNGHAYQIERARVLSGAEKVIVIMSGSFVQRGEPACADKFTRAKWALEGGADMVIELPEVLALSCAERFASGSIRIMKGTGIVDSICFGSETGDMGLLKKAAAFSREPEKLAEALNGGASYPAALAEATGFSPAPNDILGVEYVKAAERYFKGAELFCVERKGSAYSETGLCGEFSSASAIRNAVLSASSGSELYRSLAPALPKSVLDDIVDKASGKSNIATLEGLSDAVLYRIRSMSREELAGLPEVAEGLENLFAEKALVSNSAEEMLTGVKSKRYTMARLKRIAMNALLGVTAELQKKAAENESALYIRVLGIRRGSTELLSKLHEKASLPVIVQASDRNDICEDARQIERVSALAHSMRALGCPYDKRIAPDHSHKLIVRE